MCGDCCVCYCPAVSMWFSVPAAALYSLLGTWLLRSLPRTFTLGEAVIVAQGLTILLLDAAIQLLSLVGRQVHSVYMGEEGGC